MVDDGRKVLIPQAASAAAAAAAAASSMPFERSGNDEPIPKLSLAGFSLIAVVLGI